MIENTDDNGRQGIQTARQYGVVRQRGYIAEFNQRGNPLDKLAKVVDFEMFRETLEDGLLKEHMTNAGAKPYDPVLMFKILVLQCMCPFDSDGCRKLKADNGGTRTSMPGGQRREARSTMGTRTMSRLTAGASSSRRV